MSTIPSYLVPEKRLDKNGRLVTKHVRLETGADKSSDKKIPAPQIPLMPSDTKTMEELSDSELFDAIGRNFSRASLALTYSHMELIEGTKVYGPKRSLLEALYEATDGIDTRGAFSLLDGYGIYRHARHDQNVACLEIAARAYNFCRKVDDATLPSDEDDDQFHFYDKLGSFTKNFLDEDISDGTDPGDVTDIEGAYLLNRLDIEQASFNTDGAYYRALVKLKERRDDIVDYLPLLITARMVERGQNRTFEEIMFLVDELKEACPPEKAYAVATEVKNRREFNLGIVEEMAALGASPMLDGAL